MGLISGAESQPLSHLQQDSVQSLDGSVLGARKGPVKAGPKGGQGLGLPHTLSTYLSA